MWWFYACIYTSKSSFILNNLKLETLDLKTGAEQDYYYVC